MAIHIQDANLHFNGNHTDRQGAPKGIVLHHVGGEGGVDDIHRYHQQGNGWAGIGYHFYVRKDGSIWYGRPEQWLGAHTSGYNDYIGVCAEGNFEKETMPEEQKAAVVAVLQYLYGKYGPLNVYGHRDLDTTACPGKNFPFEDIIGGVLCRDEESGAVREQTQEEERYTMNLRYLGKGDQGEDVRALQILLIGRGYPCGSNGADGIFGGNTDKAVRAFQRDRRLSADGIAGPDTVGALWGV